MIDSGGVSSSAYFLMQIDISCDGVGQAVFKLLKLIFSLLEYESKNKGQKHSKLKITENKNDWKFEFSLTTSKGFKFVRAKATYSKTADKLTSCGVT